MQTSIKQLHQKVFNAINAAGFDVLESDIHLERAKTLEHGHFATNIAMLIAGKQGKNPREVAERISRELKTAPIEKAEVASPGFINLYIEQNFYTEVCHQLVDDLDRLLQTELEFIPGEKAMVSDTSHPNVAKPMGVHHLLSSIIGASINNLYRKIGYKVIADNYLGDWGTQFGKLIYAVKTWGDEKEIEKTPIDELLRLYVKFHDEAEKDPSLDERGRAEFKKFEEGDQQNRRLWKKIVDWSKDEFRKIYDRLNLHYDKMDGESFYEDKMPALLEDGREKGVFVDGEEGAWIVPSDDPSEPPAIVRKSDGSTIYLTRDLAQTAYWEKTYHPDLMVWVVDVAQSFHFKQRFHASRKLGQTKAKMEHVVFGRMQFKEKAMSTRKGNILKLEEVLDEAGERALELVKEKGIDLSEAEQKELARVMGIGSVKYNILHQNRISDITFDWSKMLTFEGNSAPYLMYTYARAKSILRKAGVSPSDVGTYPLRLTDDLEQIVALDLTIYSDAVKRAAAEFKPNHIANYLYQLAQSYNTFYNALPVLQAEADSAKQSRLLLTAATVTVMEDGMGLLGIELPEKM